MGSEAPPAVTIHFTGFKKFHEVSENPTEIIVRQGALPTLYQTMQSKKTIWVHFGVYSDAITFAIEQQAVNEATFDFPDELGWQPHQVPIVPADGGITHVRKTSLPVEEIREALSKKGFEVMTSDNAGQFVYNYVYYQSLHFAEQNGTKSLFVHMPPFLVMDEETQMQFVVSLLEVLASLCQ
ncbi:hypothetical protein SLA2020_171760 [Shorea laevis]